MTVNQLVTVSVGVEGHIMEFAGADSEADQSEPAYFLENLISLLTCDRVTTIANKHYQSLICVHDRSPRR